LGPRQGSYSRPSNLMSQKNIEELIDEYGGVYNGPG